MTKRSNKIYNDSLNNTTETVEERLSLNTLQKIQSLIEQGEATISNMELLDEVVILIGKSRVGKSTLINCFADAELEIKEGSLKEKYIHVTNPVMEVAAGAASCTTTPNIWNDNNVSYIDCPGFLDTHGPDQDIANAFFIKRVFDQAKGKNIKILLVHSIIDLKDTAEYFINSIENYTTLLSNENLDELIKSTLMIFTKVDPAISEEDVYTKIGEIVDARFDDTDNNKWNAPQKKLFRALLREKIKLSVFHEPESLNSSEEIKLETNEIKSVIFNPVNEGGLTPYQLTLEVNITIADRSVIHLRDVADDVVNTSATCLNLLIQDLSEVEKISEQYIKEKSIIDIINDLQLRNFEIELNDEAFANINNFKNCKNEIDNFINNKAKDNDSDIVDQLRTNLTFLGFIDKCNPFGDASLSYYLPLIRSLESFQSVLISKKNNIADIAKQRVTSSINKVIEDYSSFIKANLESEDQSNIEKLFFLQKVLNKFNQPSTENEENVEKLYNFLKLFNNDNSDGNSLIEAIELNEGVINDLLQLDIDKNSNSENPDNSAIENKTVLTHLMDKFSRLNDAIEKLEIKIQDQIQQEWHTSIDIIFSTIVQTVNELCATKKTENILEKKLLQETVSVLINEYKEQNMYILLESCKELNNQFNLGEVLGSPIEFALDLLAASNTNTIKIEDLYEDRHHKELLECQNKLRHSIDEARLQQTKSLSTDIIDAYSDLLVNIGSIYSTHKQDNKIIDLIITILENSKGVFEVLRDGNGGDAIVFIENLNQITDDILNTKLEARLCNKIVHSIQLFSNVVTTSLEQELYLEKSFDCKEALWLDKIGKLLPAFKARADINLNFEKFSNVMEKFSNKLVNFYKFELPHKKDSTLSNISEEYNELISRIKDLDELFNSHNGCIALEKFSNYFQEHFISDELTKKMLKFLKTLPQELEITKEHCSSFLEIEHLIKYEQEEYIKLEDFRKKLIGEKVNLKYLKILKNGSNEDWQKYLKNLIEDFNGSENHIQQSAIDVVNHIFASHNYGYKNRDLEVSGNVINLSEIKNYIEKNHYTIARIVINAYDSMIFDTNIKLPGADMIIYAPNWQIKDRSIKIDLRGEEGLRYFEPAEDGQGWSDGLYTPCWHGIPGKDGLPGRAGMNGGSFKIMTTNVETYGDRKLIINVSGGNGGRGQNGGNGNDGMPTESNSIRNWDNELKFNDSGYTDLIDIGRTSYYMKHPLVKGLTKNKTLSEACTDFNFANERQHNEYVLYTYVRMGYPGGEGGVGGVGGKGGNLGSVMVNEEIRQLVNIKIIQETGAPGKPGNPGLCGNFGKYSDVLYDVVYGQYANKYEELVASFKGYDNKEIFKKLKKFIKYSCTKDELKSHHIVEKLKLENCMPNTRGVEEPMGNDFGDDVSLEERVIKTFKDFSNQNNVYNKLVGSEYSVFLESAPNLVLVQNNVLHIENNNTEEPLELGHSDSFSEKDIYISPFLNVEQDDTAQLTGQVQATHEE